MLTTVQKQALKTHALAQPEIAGVFAPATPSNPIGGSLSALRDYYHALASPAFFVWRKDVPVEDIFERINWANLTPEVPANEANQDIDAVFRSNVCLSMQMSIQTMLMGRSTVDATRANIRNGLRDALSAVPSAANGSTRAAGWTQVQNVIARQASRVEALFADTTSGTGGGATTAAQPRIDGLVPDEDFLAVLRLP